MALKVRELESQLSRDRVPASSSRKPCAMPTINENSDHAVSSPATRDAVYIQGDDFSERIELRSSAGSVQSAV